MSNEEKILSILYQMQVGFSELRTDVAELKTDVAELKTDVAELKTDVAELKTDVAELKERTTKIEITQENVVLPRIQLLAEGHMDIQAQIKRLSVIDGMQDDIATLKTAVRFLSQKVEQLEKAM